LNDRLSDNEILRRKLEETENRLTLVVAENERLNNYIEDKGREIEIWKGSQFESETRKATINDLQTKVSLLVSENERLQTVIQERNKEIEITKSKAMRGSFLDTSGVKTHVVANLQAKVVLLSAEVERLNNLLGQGVERREEEVHLEQEDR
jgi:uncharacterized small protein (DUF1192 family)